MAQDSARRRGRALAMKILYQADAGRASLDDIIAGFDECIKAPPRVREFAMELARGVAGKRGEIDSRIKESLQNWEFDRLASVDLELLRIAVYEMLYCDDISANIAIDEAIELARQYSTRESSKFINGVLAGVCSRHAPHKIARGAG